MPLGVALALGVLTALANLAGGVGSVLARSLPRPLMAGLLGFGGGFLLAAALLEMAPEALEGGPWMPSFIVLGYLLVFAVEQALGLHFHALPREGGDPARPAGALLPLSTAVAAVVAFNIHDFLDGLAIGAGAVEAPSLGFLAFLAVLAHEVPAGFVVASLMLGAGRGPLPALLAAASIGLITLVGIAVPFLAGEVSPFMARVLLALATGSFLYVGASLLIPLSEEGGPRRALLWVSLGLLLSWGSGQALSLLLG